MGQQQKKNYNKKGPKTIIKSLPLVLTGTDHKGNKYNVESCKQLLAELQDNGVFSKLSVNVTIARHLLDSSYDRGIMTIARIQSIDIEEGEFVIMVFGKSAEYAKLLNDKVIVPRVRIGRDSSDVTAIFGFEIVEPVFSSAD